jgi:hypothetical protein
MEFAGDGNTTFERCAYSAPVVPPTPQCAVALNDLKQLIEAGLHEGVLSRKELLRLIFQLTVLSSRAAQLERGNVLPRSGEGC